MDELSKAKNSLNMIIVTLKYAQKSRRKILRKGC